MTKHKGGAPSTFTKVAADRVVQHLSLGGTVDHACQFAGISRDTFYKWVKKGEREKSGQFREFADAVKGANGTAITRALIRINKGTQNWQSSAWLLERRFRNDYGRLRVELSGPDDQPVQTDTRVMIYLPENGRKPTV